MLSRTPIEVTPGVWATGEVPRKSFETIMELGKSRLLKVEGGSETMDSIPDDQSLFLREKSVGLVVVTGCAHSGPLNILSHVEAITGEKVKALIGGTHLTGRKPEYTKATIDGLRGFDLETPVSLSLHRVQSDGRTGTSFPSLLRAELFR